jgi:hypothetical protein
MRLSDAELDRGDALMRRLGLSRNCPDCGAKKVKQPWGDLGFEDPQCEVHHHDLIGWLAVGGSKRTWDFARIWPGDPTSFTAAVDQWLEQQSYKTGDGLAFFGTFGCGKTSALSYAAMKSGLKPRLVKFGELLSNDCNVAGLIDARILMIDELARPRTDAQLDFFATRLHEIVDARYDLIAPTLISSNMTTEDFRQAYPSVTSRLLDQGEVIEDFDVADFRGD